MENKNVFLINPATLSDYQFNTNYLATQKHIDIYSITDHFNMVMDYIT